MADFKQEQITYTRIGINQFQIYSYNWLNFDIGKRMKLYMISIACITFTIFSCGDRNIRNNNCVPPVKYISTNDAIFISYQLIDQSQWRSFDALQVSKNGEWLLQIVRNGSQTIVDHAGDSIISEEHPKGTLLSLTGRAITRSPFGLSTAFHDDMTYLQGIIGKKTVWIPAFYLYILNDNGTQENITSNQKIGLESFRLDWECITR